MITLDFISEQLHAQPFVSFTLILNSGDRYAIKSPDYADEPPPDEDTGQRRPWLIVYNRNAVPRYLALENIASVEMSSV